MKFVALSATLLAFAAGTSASEPLTLTQGERATASVLVVTAGEAGWLEAHAAGELTDRVKRYSAVTLPSEILTVTSAAEKKAAAQRLARADGIVLTTWDLLRELAPAWVDANDLLLRTQHLCAGGFVCTRVSGGDADAYLIAANSRRGMYNGAVHVAEMQLDGPADALTLATPAFAKVPQMEGRPDYALTIWGEEDNYTVQDWETVFDSFARDGITTVYFWFSGHFPSKKFPQTYRVADDEFDSSVDSGIPTLEDQRRIIAAAHERGMDILLSGALGGWVGTRFLTNLKRETMKHPFDKPIPGECSYQGKYSLCPSHPESRQALLDYYLEMLAALPEADGFHIESADEWGECLCDRCQQPVDAYGSKQFGQNQLSLVQQLMQRAWETHPDARLAYTIGYTPHRSDPAYYEVVRQMSNDNRIEWMESRDSWTFPGPGGQQLPAAYFSDQVMRWEYEDQKDLNTLLADIRRAARDGMHGFVSTFSPGFASGSFYHDVPFPTGRFPYLLTHFIVREMTFNPALTDAQLRDLIGQRFFGSQTTDQHITDLWNLREFLRLSATPGFDPQQEGEQNKENAHLTLTELNAIAHRTRTALETATPKSRETLNLMLSAIDDIRQHAN